MGHIATLNTTVARGGKRIELTGGKPVPKLPEGVMAALINSGAAVDEEKWGEMNAPPPKDEKPLVEGRKVGDWQNMPVTDLDVPEEAKEAYVAANLTTVRKLLEYGEKHGGLQDLKGIGESLEKQTQKAIADLAK